MEFECWWELRLTLLLIILVRTFRDDVGEISLFNTEEWDSFFVITDHLQPCLTVSPSHQATGLDWTGCRLEADWAGEGAGQLLVQGDHNYPPSPHSPHTSTLHSSHINHLTIKNP